MGNLWLVTVRCPPLGKGKLFGQFALPLGGREGKARTALLAAVRRSALVVSFLTSSLNFCLLLPERQNRTFRTYIFLTQNTYIA